MNPRVDSPSQSPSPTPQPSTQHYPRDISMYPTSTGQLTGGGVMPGVRPTYSSAPNYSYDPHCKCGFCIAVRMSSYTARPVYPSYMTPSSTTPGYIPVNGSNGQMYSSNGQMFSSYGQMYGSNGQTSSPYGQVYGSNGQMYSSNGQTYGSLSSSLSQRPASIQRATETPDRDKVVTSIKRGASPGEPVARPTAAPQETLPTANGQRNRASQSLPPVPSLRDEGNSAMSMGMGNRYPSSRRPDLEFRPTVQTRRLEQQNVVAFGSSINKEHGNLKDHPQPKSKLSTELSAGVVRSKQPAARKQKLKNQEKVQFHVVRKRGNGGKDMDGDDADFSSYWKSEEEIMDKWLAKRGYEGNQASGKPGYSEACHEYLDIREKKLKEKTAGNEREKNKQNRKEKT